MPRQSPRTTARTLTPYTGCHERRQRYQRTGCDCTLPNTANIACIPPSERLSGQSYHGSSRQSCYGTPGETNTCSQWRGRFYSVTECTIKTVERTPWSVLVAGAFSGLRPLPGTQVGTYRPSHAPGEQRHESLVSAPPPPLPHPPQPTTGLDPDTWTRAAIGAKNGRGACVTVAMGCGSPHPRPRPRVAHNSIWERRRRAAGLQSRGTAADRMPLHPGPERRCAAQQGGQLEGPGGLL